MSKDLYCKVLLTSGEEILDCFVAKTFLERLLGIMFKRSFPYSGLLFKDSFWIHSFFCLSTFHVVFLDKNFNILTNLYNIKPNTVLPPIWGAKYVIEFFDESIKFEKGERLKLEFYEKER